MLFQTRRYLLQDKTLREIEFEKFMKPKDDAILRMKIPHIPLPKTCAGQVDWKSVESWPVVLKILRIRSQKKELAQREQKSHPQSTNEVNCFISEINAQLDCRHRNILPLLGFPSNLLETFHSTFRFS